MMARLSESSLSVHEVSRRYYTFFKKVWDKKNIKREPINQALIEKPGWSFLAMEKSHN